MTASSNASVSESTVEAAALGWLDSIGWTVTHGPDVAPGTPAAERADYGAVVLETRLRSALARLNPNLPADALEDAQRRLTRPAGAMLEARNRTFRGQQPRPRVHAHALVDDAVELEQVRAAAACFAAEACHARSPGS